MSTWQLCQKVYLRRRAETLLVRWHSVVYIESWRRIVLRHVISTEISAGFVTLPLTKKSMEKMHRRLIDFVTSQAQAKYQADTRFQRKHGHM